MINIPQVSQVDYKESAPTVWYGCYDGGWQGLITDQAFQHPAKFSRNLVNRIYAYALERGWLKAGDTVLDPFGGVSLGALDAGANGLNWVGVELERRFCDLGQGCDCTGISKADWVRFYGRWEKANYKAGRHWCPECLAEARRINPPAPRSFTLSLFGDEPAPSAAYTRNSGIIPETKPHHYTGNLELFKRYARPGTFAVLLNGDSRNLRAVIGQGVAEGLLSSPPYAGSRIAQEGGDDSKNLRRTTSNGRYGLTGGQLGGMSEGSLDGAISSPPYINSVNQSAGANDTEARIERMRQAGIDVTNRANVGGGNGVARQPQNYGDSTGQLGAMPAGSLADSLLSSPPYINSLKAESSEQTQRKQSRIARSKSIYDGRKAESESAGKAGLGGGYGASDGQLSELPEGNLSGLLSSPPFAGNTGGRGEASRNGIDAALFDRHSGGMKKGTGDNPANLDHLPMRGFDAALGSPPFEGSLATNVHTIGFEQITGNMHRKPGTTSPSEVRQVYGSTPGQLGSMSGGFDASLASPPFENGVPQQDKNFKAPHDSTGYLKGDYGTTAGQLGTEQGGTFWEAAKMIVYEAYLALKPGAVTFWVTKRFVRDGAIVDFTGQWRQLCEACGFEFVEHIQAMLIQSESEQGNLNGDVIKTKKKKASFFRRLHEKRFPHLAIDHEDVLVLRKPEALP